MDTQTVTTYDSSNSSSMRRTTCFSAIWMGRRMGLYVCDASHSSRENSFCWARVLIIASMGVENAMYMRTCAEMARGGI